MRTIALLILLAGSAGAASACEASKAQFAIGQGWSDALAEDARRAAGADIVRRMVHGHAYTMEFSAGRLNLRTDAAGRVLAVFCG